MSLKKRLPRWQALALHLAPALVWMAAASPAQAQTPTPTPAAAETKGTATAPPPTAPATLAVDSNTADAQAAALQWLALADANNGPGSWAQTAPLFQAAVPQEKWAQALIKVHEPLGALTSRQLEAATLRDQMPGAPVGEYALIRYQSVFALRPSATEVVSLQRGPDGRWRVAGYFIQ